MLGFALGSIPFGVVVAKRLGVDIKQHGSGNIGATNVTRVLGLIPGAIVLALDVAKGALAVWLARGCTDWVIAAVGFAAILGHCFSPWLGGRGGKGVATALGVFLVISPPLTGIAVLVFGAVLALSKIPALGSLAGVMTIALILVYRTERPFATLALATALLLVYTHRTNLAKLKINLK
ncbi:MAG: glycerol-3-phosphate acyltransferase [Deltaproteobacteria bacterium]|nr:glycerol-3-phosphate acyltransferase [Deltaproteobacteria bacterium]